MESMTGTTVLAEMNALLQHELTCVSVYELALAEVEEASDSLRGALQEIARGHCRNTRTLREEILRLGGVPAPASEPSWLLEASEECADEDAVVHALAGGEENAIRRYEDAARRLPGACRALVVEVLLPARRRNLMALRSLETGVPPGHADCTNVTPGEGTLMSPGIKEVAL